MSDVPEPPTGRGMDAASETVVGTVAEPGERADEFVFVAPDAVDVRTGSSSSTRRPPRATPVTYSPG